jgi:hypothetical protein
MIQILETPSKTLRIWKLCQDAFALHGIRLTFPKNTDPHKTYQWRYVSRLTRKIDEWGFDKPTAKAFIDFSVGYVSERKLLHKGLSVFFQSNMLDVCYNRMKKHSDRMSKRVGQFNLSHMFITAKCKGRPITKVLLDRESFDSFRNITRWFESGDLSAIYLATSIGCTKALSALATIAPNERSLLPPESELYCLALNASKDDDFRSQTKTILGNDWRMTLCQQR